MAHLKLQDGRYFPAERILNGRSSNGIGHNTRLERLADDRIGVRFHATVIYVVTLAGWAVVDCDGWRSVTTLQRVNALLPGPWRIGSYGKRGTWLWSSGRPVAPFEDGLAVHVGNSSAGGTGAVGFSADRGQTIENVMSADDVAAVIAAADAVTAERDRKRAARLELEHPTARPITYRADVIHSRSYSSYYTPLESPHRMGAWRSAGECGRCKAELEAWRAMRADVLAADHDDAHAWSVTVNGATISEPAGPCPWDCPRRSLTNGGF